MATEIEAKFLQVDIEHIRRKLQDIGAELAIPMRLMRRDQFDHADERYQTMNFSERLRIRDEGNVCTMTFKSHPAGAIYSEELETTIGSYEQTKAILEAIGLHSFSYQESRRETWHVGEVEVVIDEWPWLQPYIEIEGPTEVSIQSVAAELGFAWSGAKYGSVDTAYREQYPKMTPEDSIGYIAKVSFDAPLPEYLEDRM